MTNEESNLEEGVPTSLSNGPGAYTREDWLNYYTVQLRMWRIRSTDRAMQRMRRRDPLLVDAIEGILKHGR